MMEKKGVSDVKLLLQAVTKFVLGIFLVGAFIFVPAGGFGFSNGILLMCLLFIPMLILGVVLFFKAPDLLKKRLDTKEKEKTQKGVVALSALMFPAGFIVAGLDHRFGWSNVPLWAVILASVTLLISYAMYAEVMRENAYLSRVIKVQEGQKVVDTGLYGIIRHPMYGVTLWLFYSFPIVLGSLWALLCFLPYAAVIAIRISNEEKVLSASLPGYAEYKKKVRWRLIPFLW